MAYRRSRASRMRRQRGSGGTRRPTLRGRGMPGDANNNRWVNQQDVYVLADCVMHGNCSQLDNIYGQPASQNADVNNDGFWNALDISATRGIIDQNLNMGQFRRGGRVRRQRGGGDVTMNKPKPWNGK